MADGEGTGDNIPPVKAESQPINIVVRDQNNSEVHFKIKTATRFQKVIDAYCDKKSLNAETVRFMYDGRRVLKDQTPADLDMEDGDAIDVVVEQIGGW